LKPLIECKKKKWKEAIMKRRRNIFLLNPVRAAFFELFINSVLIDNKRKNRKASIQDFV